MLNSSKLVKKRVSSRDGVNYTLFLSVVGNTYQVALSIAGPRPIGQFTRPKCSYLGCSNRGARKSEYRRTRATIEVHHLLF